MKEPAVAGTSGIQKPKMVAEKPNKRPAIENIPPPTPEKRRRIERNEESSYSSIEQVTRNIENITVDENNFSVVVNAFVCLSLLLFTFTEIFAY